MEEQLINFETAKLAQQKGFDNESNTYYNEEGELLNDIYFPSLQPTKLCKYYDVPTQSLLQKWLRDVHNIIVQADYNNTFNYFEDKIFCPQLYPAPTEYQKETHNTYEKALEFGLQEALKLIKL